MAVFRDIRDFEEYKDREEAEASSRYSRLAERDGSFSISSALFQPISVPPSPSGEGGQGDGDYSVSVPPQNLDRRTSAGRQAGPSTVFGNEAWTKVGDWKAQRFVTPSIAVPCVARSVRREVMFAKRLAGKGYRTRKRLNPYSDVEC